MTSSWLVRKRKGELLELARQANVPDADGLLKDDLVIALQDRLEANETIYGKSSVFNDFYKRGSPIKRERTSSEGLAIVKPRRRQTIKSQDSDDVTPEKSIVSRVEKSIVARTPRVEALQRRLSEVDLPASPSQLAEVADQSFQAAKSKAEELWEKSHIEEAIATIRENASSVVFIQLAVLFIEGAGLGWNNLNTVQWGTAPEWVPYYYSSDIRLPDPFVLLTRNFWAPATLWSVTNWGLPLLFSYFFNLTLKSNTNHKSSNKTHAVDPLTFNIARALLAYSAYTIPTTTQAAASQVNDPDAVTTWVPGWGPFAEATVNTVRNHIPGNYYGIQIGSLIGALVSLYDAALKK